ncbi:enoyl-CoA hydratase-related protein [Pseudoprimorskyibacter insulae]|uniref:Fatty acid oxidation complex subunit alpha n=1 Tax=Pseudoprimorskyibacter insulae TaxID=1695997 RepID=A0A2R8AZX0_9RHOB|nr:enoyl-CoA hydratase-related protein [Pseudoprimorskyibacter insulae]SPF81563.1 Fatty acid oxidation complex subunit alpha [Pseudoprimorskyibacter insulae]
MVESVKMSVADGVAFLVIEGGAGNAMTVDIRSACLDAIKAAEANSDVSEIVLLGHGARFPSGPSLVELGKGEASPTLADLCLAIEGCSKPVVAGVMGAAQSGGMELLLAAHYRIADKRARVGFPSVRQGVIPCAGGTQRAPRLIGVSATLDLLLTGALIPVTDARLANLFDTITELPLAQAALSFCQTLRGSGQGPRPTEDRAEGVADFASANASIKAARDAAESAAAIEAVSCVEASLLLPYSAGLVFEAEAFQTVIATSESAALRHAYTSEFRAATAPVPGGARPTVDTLAILGHTAFAVRLVMAALSAGCAVHWGGDVPEQRKEAIAALVRLMGGNPEDSRFELLRTGPVQDMLDDVDIVLLAAPVDGGLDTPEGLAVFKLYPDRVDHVGLRFSGNMERGRLAEIIAGPDATQAQIAAAITLSRRMAQVPVVVASSGFSICDRLAAAIFRGTDALVDQGVSFVDIDKAMIAWGWPLPPFMMRDRKGLETAARMPRAKGGANWAQVPVALGRTGLSAGKGFYDYEKGKMPVPSPEVLQAIDDKVGQRKTMTDRQIIELVLGALANEGMRMLADQWAACPGDIDVAAMLGLEFPRSLGGPMHAADQVGLLKLSKAMKAFDHPDTPFWTPHTVLADMIRNGQNFASRNPA